MSEPIYVDMWWQPSDGAIAWFKARGFAGILGYFSNGNDGLISNWADATFQRIKAAGLRTGAYCSVRANPATWKARAAALGIVIVLDHESSVDGSTSDAAVDSWLAQSGASLYGGGGTITAHHTHGHPGYVVAGYPSNSGTANPIDPGLTWSGLAPLPNPARPIGRQFAGGVPTPYGAVDYSHFDPAFFGASPPIITTEDDDMLIVNGPQGIWLLSGPLYAHIDTVAIVNSLLAAGVKAIGVDQYFHDALVAASTSHTGTSPPPVLAGTVPVTGSLTFG